MNQPTVPTTPPSAPPPAAPRGGSVPWIISLALAAVVGALLFTAGFLAGGSGTGSGCAAPDEAFAAFCEAYDRLQREYVDELDSEELAEGALRGMFQYGVQDPNSGYMPPEQYQQALGDLSGTFSGIGAEMAIRNIEDAADLAACTELSDTCRLVVVAPLDDSPAERAGLRAGDFVLAVDGETVVGTTMDDQIGRIRGESGTDVTLTLEREGGEPFDVTITRAEITLQEVETRMIEGHIGYIALNGFSAPAADQFRDGLASLLEEGAGQIVLDLRDNPGGYIDAAQQIASQFIDQGLIFTQESAGDDVREWPSTGDGVATDADLPVVVLINAGSASASEIVAAALQESGRATLIGEPSFGKNTVQVWSRLENNGGIRITISRWFTPDHNSVAPDGIQPDITAARTADTPPEEDPILDAALAFLDDQPVAGSALGARVSGTPTADVRLPAVVGIVGSRGIC
ncbi:MAG: S41 family peptidase [Chloroflexota bacterium]|nr:S41 family peptidase [Chloroflexota bacterium]